MNRLPLEIGRVVRSTAGRDEGRLFLVIGEADEQHLLIADGGLRRTDRPKKKKRRHLKATVHAIDQDAAARMQDHEIRRLLDDVKLSEEG